MNGQPTPRRRETFLVLFLTIALAFAITVFTMMITGQFFFAILSVVVGMLVLGFLQYVIWGWPMQPNRGPANRENMHFPR